MTRVVMMKGRTRMAWRRLVSPWGEGEKESLVSHPKTIMKDARSQSSRTHAPQARRHAARPPSTAQAGRQGEMVLLCTTTVVGGGGRPNAVCSSVLVCVKGRLLSVKLQGRKTKDKTEIDLLIGSDWSSRTGSPPPPSSSSLLLTGFTHQPCP